MDRHGVTSGPGVAQWYAGRAVLVTGGTGFLGKAIIEKLVRSCPGIKTIYMLVRPKRGQSPRDRVEAYTSDVVFSKVRAERPDFARHLSVIAGDLSAPDFRLEEQDLAALRRDVSIIFHCAASVRVDVNLRTAVTSNVVGTQRVLRLAEQLPNLQVFLYISTSFCHSDQQVLEEKLYPAEADPEKIMDIVSWMDDDLLDAITPKLLRKLPNTYALTKNLTEELVARYSDRLPIVIARPSIVCSSWKEPLEGWAANKNSLMGMLIAAGKGLLRTVMVDTDLTPDLIPVDCTANTIVVAAWHFVQTSQLSPYVCNVTNGQQVVLSWREIVTYALDICTREVPMRPIQWYPAVSLTKSFVWYTIRHFFLDIIPAQILDFLILLSGKKPFLVNIQNRLKAGNTMLLYYGLHDWTFTNKNLMSFNEYMAPEDQETFYINFSSIEPHSYFKNTIIGAKLYLLNEKVDNISSDLRYLRRMYWLYLTVQVIFCSLLLWLLYSWSQPALEMLEIALAYLASWFHGAPIVRALADESSVPYTAVTQDVVDMTVS